MWTKHLFARKLEWGHGFHCLIIIKLTLTYTHWHTYTHQYMSSSEQVAERVVEQVNEGGCIQVGVTHHLGGKQSLSGATAEKASHHAIAHVHVMCHFLTGKKRRHMLMRQREICFDAILFELCCYGWTKWFDYADKTNLTAFACYRIYLWQVVFRYSYYKYSYTDWRTL